MAFLPIIPPTVSEGFCTTLGPDWIQQLANEIVGKAVAVWQDQGTIVLYQEAQPNPNQRAFLWYRPSTGLTYYYDSGTGAWIAPHRYSANDPVASMWVEATPAQIWAFDGGDGSDPASNPPTANNGAMWVIDTNYAGRSPMGVGSIPNANPAKSLSVGENYGEGAHTMTDQEVAAHDHPIVSRASISHDGVVDVVTSSASTDDGLLIGESGTLSDALTIQDNTFTATQEAMPVIHPVRGQYRIVRSARVNYVGS